MRKNRTRRKTNIFTNPKDFWMDGLSIDESRVSILMTLLVAFSGFGIYLSIRDGDIPTNMMQIIIALATAVAGVNIADTFANRKTSQEVSYTGEVYRQDTIVTNDTDTTSVRTDDDQTPTI